jgi:signal transduction histidine kinase/ActR/RegA family two-component response regulator
LSYPHDISIFHATPVVSVVLDPELRIVDVNDACVRALGRPREAMVGQSHFDVFPENPKQAQRDGERLLRDSFRRVFQTGRPDSLAVQKYDLALADGGYDVRFWSPSNYPVFVHGKVRYVLHTAEDVTDFVLSRKAQDADVDRMARDILVRSKEVQQTNAQLREVQVQLEALNAQLEARVQERSAALEAELRERERVEEQFRQAQKMEAIGLLAGGVAHDFNNLLTVILGCADALADEPLTEEGRRDLEEVQHAARRAATLTSQLLTFSRRNLHAPAVLSLDQVLTEACTLWKRVVGENVTLAVRSPARLSRVEVDRGLLDQALLNVVINARDAMPRGGSLVVETRDATLTHRLPNGVLGAPAGEYVVIEVRDTGEGMTPGQRDKLFLPFFTTKPLGRGSGLGLAMVHGMVKQSRGEIVIETQRGQGTTVQLYFPVTTKEPSASSQLQTVSPARAHETVLVVEDDRPVREVTVRVLSDAGYRVLAAAHPQEALALGKEAGFRVDLVVSDVVMPGMDGPTLVKHLLSGKPRVKVLYMSGYTGVPLLERFLPMGPDTFLPKPFTPQDLLARVRLALDTRPHEQSAES